MFETIKEFFNLNKAIEKKKSELGLLESEQKKVYEQKQKEFEDIILKRKEELSNINTEISNKDNYIMEIDNLKSQINDLEKSTLSQKKKLADIKELYKAMNNAIKKYFTNEAIENTFLIQNEYIKSAEELSPTVTLNLNYMDSTELKKAYNDNNKLITKTLEKYKDRYTTKANIAIYKLMVIALKAELQNILYNLKYENYDKSLEKLKEVTKKYLLIATEGNQSIAGTMVKFIGEIEYLFTNALQIEYKYYAKKQQEKEEQIALREQMKQEAEERKMLEDQKKQIEKEESKYKTEIDKLREIILDTEDTKKVQELENRINEIQNQLEKVEEKKEEIVNLQNGKAGYVYVISNLGSFGNDVFKIGMTRRLEPQDRINELGNASVPFAFDVHTFIFSEDAVQLEKKIHTAFDKKRLNKVNLRKEFFKININELEDFVRSIDPSASFNKTMLAEEYNQSLQVN